MKRISAILILLTLFSACTASSSGYGRYQKEFYDLFDTHTIVCGYAKSEKEFGKYADVIYNEMLRLHRLFDIYNDYDGVNNLKTVNDNAGIAKVEVDASIIELLSKAKLAYADSGGAVNAAMGSVLRIWHDFRELGAANPAAARLPEMEKLREAALNTNIDDLIIDEAARTVFLKKAGMSLDVGALAKGFAVQKAVDAAMQAGFSSGFIDSGGNVRVVGKPMSGKDSWSVGIQNPVPAPDDSAALFDTVSVTDMAAVSSGGYQRFYVVDGKAYNHIIDPETLTPAERFSAVTVLHPDSGTADMLSTAIYIMPYEQGFSLIQKYGANAVWISADGTIRATDGYKAVSHMFSR